MKILILFTLLFSSLTFAETIKFDCETDHEIMPKLSFSLDSEDNVILPETETETETRFKDYYINLRAFGNDSVMIVEFFNDFDQPEYKLVLEKVAASYYSATLATTATPSGNREVGIGACEVF